MLFNSFEFVLFVIPLFFVYWLVFKNSNTYQNILLLVSSLFFYGWADWRFLGLLILSTLLNYYLGLKIARAVDDRKRQYFLWAGLAFNLGLLLYFKYCNFFYEGFSELLGLIGSDAQFSPLQIIIPLGISFFTFQTLGYLLDVYNEEIEPSYDMLKFAVYVTYFPKILSGPIERAQTFLPQIEKKRIFSGPMVIDGLRQILWGLFAKVVVAENCADLVNPIFTNYENEPGGVLLIGAFFYAIQLYADFSGYSNMAIGVSKLFGIRLMRNFATPYYSTNISDFWRKWHISLTTWMMDYVFTPLSFTLRRFQKTGLIISIIVTFVLVGFWHGANYTFIVYGLLHGLYFIPLVISGSMNKSAIVAKGKWFPSFLELIKMSSLFLLVMLTAVFFKADNVGVAIEYLANIPRQGFLQPSENAWSGEVLLRLGFVGIFMFVEWCHREREHDFEISYMNQILRWCLYVAFFVLILFFRKSSDTFIYFQF